MPSAINSRAERHVAILALIDTRSVRSQAELAELLAKKGHRVNQGTLSRDLHELGVLKGPDGYALPEGGAAPDQLTRAVRNWLLEASPVANQLVLHTPPSGAQPLGLAIDEAGLEEVVGSVAGDDTILVICRSPRAATKLAKALLSALPSH